MRSTLTVKTVCFHANFSSDFRGSKRICELENQRNSALNPTLTPVFNNEIPNSIAFWYSLSLDLLIQSDKLSHKEIHTFYRSGHRRPLLRELGRRYFSVSSEDYAKRNYANNVSEYNTVVSSLTAQRRFLLFSPLYTALQSLALHVSKCVNKFIDAHNRYFLLRDVYDDMMIDGVQPTRDTFHSLIVGTMKGGRLQDTFFFRDQMKAMGLVPDVWLCF